MNKTVLLIHIGKTCGTTVGQFLKGQGITHKEIHQQPVPPSLIPLFDIVIIPVRDPMARTISAFHYCLDRWVKAGRLEPEKNKFHALFSVFNEYARNLSESTDFGTIARKGFCHISSNYCYYLGGVLGELKQHPHVYIIETDTCQHDIIGMFKSVGWQTNKTKISQHLQETSNDKESLGVEMTTKGYLSMTGEYDTYQSLMEIL